MGIVRGMCLVVASLGVAAWAQITDAFDPTAITVEGRVGYRAATVPTEARAGQLKTLVYVRATSPSGATIQYGGCPVNVRMYLSPTRTGRPQWDAFDMPNAVCVLPLNISRLKRGQELALSALTDSWDVLGDSLAAGRYYVAAVVRPNGDSLVLDAGEANLSP